MIAAIFGTAGQFKEFFKDIYLNFVNLLLYTDRISSDGLLSQVINHLLCSRQPVQHGVTGFLVGLVTLYEVL